MRELTKALGSFSIAISAFGAQQALNLVRRPVPGDGHPTTSGLNAVSQATGQQLDTYLQQAFEASDRIQRSTVDLAFGVLSGEALNPNRLVALSSDILRQSTEAVRQLVPGGLSSASSAASGKAGGWGPMPPVS